MTLKEYDAMMEANGTPKVWCVDYAVSSPGMVHSALFKTEEEARAFANGMTRVVSIGETWDIWYWTAKHW